MRTFRCRAKPFAKQRRQQVMRIPGASRPTKVGVHGSVGEVWRRDSSPPHFLRARRAPGAHASQLSCAYPPKTRPSPVDTMVSVEPLRSHLHRPRVFSVVHHCCQSQTSCPAAACARCCDSGVDHSSGPLVEFTVRESIA